MKPVMAAAAASTEAREEELVAGAQAGSPEAFEALFRRYRDRIAQLRARERSRRGPHRRRRPGDLLLGPQQPFEAFEHPAPSDSWLYQIARNACLDEARRRSRQDDLILGWEEFPPPDERIVIHNQGADRMLSRKEELANLTQALDGLPQSQHDALVLRELEGMSYDEIGRRMRLSRPAVESVLFRARRGLQGRIRRDSDRPSLPPDAGPHGRDRRGHGRAARAAEADSPHARLRTLSPRGCGPRAERPGRAVGRASRSGARVLAGRRLPAASRLLRPPCRGDGDALIHRELLVRGAGAERRVPV